MAIASVVAHKVSAINLDTVREKGNNAIIPVAVLPDKKDWVADHNISMLMLDG
jgi:hypothetical protein